MNIKLTNKAYKGVEGYKMVSFETVETLIAKGILEINNLQAAEVCFKFKYTFVVDQFEMEAV